MNFVDGPGQKHTTWNIFRLYFNYALNRFSAFDSNLFLIISFPFIHTCRTTRHIENFTKSNAFLPKLKFFRHQLNTNFRGKAEVKRKFLWKFLKFLKRNSAYPMTWKVPIFVFLRYNRKGALSVKVQQLWFWERKIRRYSGVRRNISE